MLFVPRQVLLELVTVGQASVTVDPLFARDLFLGPVSTLEDTNGKPSWGVCLYMWVVMAAAPVLLCIGLTQALMDQDWRVVLALIATPVLAYLTRLTLMFRLKATVIVLMIAMLTSVFLGQPPWLTCLAGALFGYFFSYWYAAAVVRNLIMRSDRAYTLFFAGLRIEIRA